MESVGELEPLIVAAPKTDDISTDLSPSEASVEVVSEVVQTLERDSLGLLELILKSPDRLDRLIRDPEYQPELLSRFLGISLVGFSFFGVAMSLVLSASSVWPQLAAVDAVLAGREPTILKFTKSADLSFTAHWLNGDALRLVAAYAAGLIAATGICLPSLYFYSLLAGVRMTMMDVVLQALKSKAVAAVTLIGVLPIYATGGLAIAIFPMPQEWRDSVLALGLILPFIAGTAGTYSLYRGLSGFADTMVAKSREQRQCFLQRLVLSWAACYSAVSPVLIFTLWQRWQA
jgi:hypothetical protein